MSHIFGQSEEGHEQRIMSLMLMMLILVVFNGNFYHFTANINHFEVSIIDKYIFINYVFLMLLIFESCLISSDFVFWDDLDLHFWDKLMFKCLSGIFLLFNIGFVIYCYCVVKKNKSKRIDKCDNERYRKYKMSACQQTE